MYILVLLSLKSVSKILLLHIKIPTRHSIKAHLLLPLPWFSDFLSPDVGRNMQGPPGNGCLIPYSTLSRCNIPRTPLRLPCSPAEVSLSPGFSGQAANTAPCRGCRSYFSFSCCGSLFDLLQSPATWLSADKYLSAKLSPHHCLVFWMFFVLTY